MALGHLHLRPPPSTPLAPRASIQFKQQQTLRFYSLFSDKIRTIHCPLPRGKFFTGPSHGYLYAASHGSLHLNCYLLNPITKDVLPFASTRYQRPFLVCMGPDPVKSDDYMAFIDDTFSQTMGFYRPRYWEWTYVQMPSLELNLYHACLKGAYYMSEDETGDTVVVDIACGFSFTVPSPKIPASSDHVYFVESAGKILRIDKQLNRSFAIYHLHVEGEIGQSRWVKTNCIGNQILFLDLRNGISITASPSTGLRGNCVYYLESPGVLKYNIEDGQTEKVPCPFKTGSTWLVPDVIDYQPGTEVTRLGTSQVLPLLKGQTTFSVRPSEKLYLYTSK
ncbi:F-box protein [Rhynchospora pubera]|uniref:F-box protein n=1 Tax=Rhynchospora pubera TaxID=906938 RepID=A0AAV8H6M7_9POAL|nr:F-box protein [Rhynchospora pubera]